MEEANVKIIESAVKVLIKQKAEAHAEKYIERYKKVAYNSYLEGMYAMAELMEEL